MSATSETEVEVRRHDRQPLLRRVGDIEVLGVVDDDTAGVSIAVTVHPAGSRAPLHSSRGMEHHFVISGSVTGVHGGQSFQFEAGDYFGWRAEVQHGVWNSSGTEARILSVRVADPA